MMKVLIDNGHGITTPGKRSPDGKFLEYKYTREIARELVKRLKGRGVGAELLVPEEADISLGERCNRVNSICARIGTKNVCLVSIHTNAAGSGREWMEGKGWEAWTSVGQTEGDKLAECLYLGAEEVFKKIRPGIKLRKDMSDGDSDKEKNFTILYSTKCAACLTENLFMDNKDEVNFLTSAEGKEAIVKLHEEGIMRYINSKK